MNVNFKFGIDQKVAVEKLGITGVISMCALDESGGIIYFVKTGTEKGSEWYSERLLSDAEGK